MKKYLIIILLLTIGFLIGYFYKKNTDQKITIDLYEIDADCAEKARLFAAQEILQSKFNAEKKSCFVEMIRRGIVRNEYHIWDVTHNKEVVSMYSFANTDNSIEYTNQAKIYENFKKEIFELK